MNLKDYVTNYAAMDLYVDAGAKWLEEDRPGATGKLDLEVLDMACGSTCVIGQVYGAYRCMDEITGMTLSQRLDLHHAWEIEHGFLAPIVGTIRETGDGVERSLYTSIMIQEYDYLGKLWERKVQEALIREGL